MDEQELRTLAAERAIVEISAAFEAGVRRKVLNVLLEDLSEAEGDERLVIQQAVDLLRDGMLLGDFVRLARWLRPQP